MRVHAYLTHPLTKYLAGFFSWVGCCILYHPEDTSLMIIFCLCGCVCKEEYYCGWTEQFWKVQLQNIDAIREVSECKLCNMNKEVDNFSEKEALYSSPWSLVSYLLPPIFGILFFHMQYISRYKEEKIQYTIHEFLVFEEKEIEKSHTFSTCIDTARNCWWYMLSWWCICTFCCTPRR